MPDLGVAWPDLEAEAPEDNLPDAPEAQARPVTDASIERAYAVTIEGLGRLGNAEQLAEAFEAQ